MILVTGGTGFIGSHLVECLVTSGEPVRCLVRDARRLRHLDGLHVELAEADLARGAGLADAMRGVRLVFHVAGVTKARSKSEYYSGNAAATGNLARAAGAVERFVHVSSLAAAGPSPDGRPIGEDGPPAPVSDYGKSKLAGEEIVRASDLARRAVIVRPAVVYGPRDTDVLQVFQSVARGWMPRVGHGPRYFSAIYVRDLVAGLLAAGSTPAAGGRTYFLAHSDPLEWGGLAGAAAAAMGRKVREVAIPLAAARALGLAAEAWSRFTGRPGILSRDKIREAACRWWICDPRRAQREMGFTASTAAPRGIAETLAWYREAGWIRF